MSYHLFQWSLLYCWLEKYLVMLLLNAFLAVLDCTLFDRGLFPLVCKLALPVVALRVLSNAECVVCQLGTEVMKMCSSSSSSASPVLQFWSPVWSPGSSYAHPSSCCVAETDDSPSSSGIGKAANTLFTKCLWLFWRTPRDTQTLFLSCKASQEPSV